MHTSSLVYLKISGMLIIEQSIHTAPAGAIPQGLFSYAGKESLRPLKWYCLLLNVATTGKLEEK